MKYNTIIFDLDGTISNTESGIFKAFRKMMKEFGVDESKFDLKKFIGPPIQWSFYQIFGDDMRLFKALDYFRGVYLDFMPYTLVKDTRTGYEDGNIQAVMDGDLDGFINAYLKMNAGSSK